MPPRWRQWPGPAEPNLSMAYAYEAGLEPWEAVRPHLATQRLKSGIPLACSLLSPVPVLLGDLPAFLLFSLPVIWLILPWMIRSDWLANETVFLADRLLIRRGERDRHPRTVLLDNLGRIDATQDPLQARTGSCTLRFVALAENPEDPFKPFTLLLATVPDVETATASRIMERYSAAKQAQAAATILPQ